MNSLFKKKCLKLGFSVIHIILQIVMNFLPFQYFFPSFQLLPFFALVSIYRVMLKNSGDDVTLFRILPVLFSLNKIVTIFLEHGPCLFFQHFSYDPQHTTLHIFNIKQIFNNSKIKHLMWTFLASGIVLGTEYAKVMVMLRSFQALLVHHYCMGFGGEQSYSLTLALCLTACWTLENFCHLSKFQFNTLENMEMNGNPLMSLLGRLDNICIKGVLSKRMERENIGITAMGEGTMASDLDMLS